MSTSKESAPLPPLPTEGYSTFAHGLTGAALQPAPLADDPDNPPWGLFTAVLTWVASVVLLLAMNLLFVTPYVIYRANGMSAEAIKEFLTTDKTAIFLQVLGVIPAHLLTIGLVWAVVTQFGKYPFWRTLGWSWSANVGFWKSAGLAIALLVVSIILLTLIGGGETQVDQIIASSPAARYTTAFLATATAPLVEELIYRGVLYSALQRLFGMLWAVIAVAGLFTFVHVFQYQNNLGVIMAVGLLSLSLTLVRALTGRLLPCFIMHLIFNGIQSLYIAFGPYLSQPSGNSDQQAAAFMLLVRAIHTFI